MDIWLREERQLMQCFYQQLDRVKKRKKSIWLELVVRNCLFIPVWRKESSILLRITVGKYCLRLLACVL